MKKLFGLIALNCLAFVFFACPQAEEPGKQATGGFHAVILQADIPHGTLESSHTTAMRNTLVTITPRPDDGYKVAFIKMNGVELSSTGGVYRFNMPDADTLVSAEFAEGGAQIVSTVFDGSFYNGNHDYETEGGEGNFTGAVDLNGEGMTSGGKAIRIAAEKVKNYLGYKIVLNTPVDLNTVDGLILYAKTTYTGTGVADKKPAINQVVFGQAASHNEVKYTGEENAGIALTAQWKPVIVPLPKRQNSTVNTIYLYFTPAQVEGVVYYIDRIGFFADADKKLDNVILPAKKGAIPYKTNSSGPLSTNLHALTIDTKLEFSVYGSRVMLYGKDANPEVSKFLNVFTDFYDDIAYTLESTSFAGISGNLITPNDFNKPGLKLSASYDGVSSLNNKTQSGSAVPSSMTVDILPAPKTYADGKLILEDFAGIPGFQTGQSGVTPPNQPLTTGGLGELQTWDGHPYLWMGNIVASAPVYNFVGWWHDGLNHDLRGCTTITVTFKGPRHLTNPALKTVAAFSLLSGYSGVNETLITDTNPVSPSYNMLVKKSHSKLLFGDSEFSPDASGGSWINSGEPWQEVTFNVSEFAADIDLSCVTGIGLVLSKGTHLENGWLESDAADAFPSGPFRIKSIIANQ